MFPFIIFGLVGTAIFVVYPMIKNIYMSLLDYNIMPGQESEFIGLANYRTMFTDETFWYAIRNTILNTVVTVPINLFLGLFIAVLINQKFIRFKVGFRTIFYLPIVTSWVVVAYLFKYLFASGENGIINFLLIKMNILSEPINWFGNQWTALVVVWTLHIWKTVGWSMVIYLAGLQGIPKSFYEAAEIDGASEFKLLRYITFPLLRPTTTFVFINLVIGAFNIFPQVYLVTNGGPMGQTEVLQSYMYKEAFNNFNFGYASALGVTMGIIIFLLTWSQQKKIASQSIRY